MFNLEISNIYKLVEIKFFYIRMPDIQNKNFDPYDNIYRPRMYRSQNTYELLVSPYIH